MVRTKPSRLRRQLALAAMSAGMLLAPAAQAAPWNAIAFTAWQTAIQPQAGCSDAAADSQGASSALSALDRIMLQQSGVAESRSASPLNEAGRIVPMAMRSAAGRRMEPAAAGVRCARLAPSISGGFKGGSLGRAKADTDFLDSRIVPISRTGFDAQWDRVSARGAGQANVRSAVLSAGEGASRRAKLAAVNRWVNARVRFTEDSVNYGRRDYWADAAETLRRGAGDCEDYAIAKMQILAAMGIAREDMFLTLARDKIRRADHAMLVVMLDGQPMVLDNGSDVLLDGTAANEFRPVYSFSGDRRFLHGF